MSKVRLSCAVSNSNSTLFQIFVYTVRCHHALRSNQSVSTSHPFKSHPSKSQPTLATAISLGVVLPRPTPRWWGNIIPRARRTAALIVPDLLLLTPRVARRRSTLAPLPFTIDDRSNVQEAHDGSTHRVRNNRTTPLACQLQPKAAVNHAENDGDAPDTDVSV